MIYPNIVISCLPISTAVTIINIGDTYGVTTSLNEVVVSKGIVMLEGDMNG